MDKQDVSAHGRRDGRGGLSITHSMYNKEREVETCFGEGELGETTSGPGGPHAPLSQKQHRFVLTESNT